MPIPNGGLPGMFDSLSTQRSPELPPGKHNYGRSQCFMGKSLICIGTSHFLTGKSQFLMGQLPFLLGKLNVNQVWLWHNDLLIWPCSIAMLGVTRRKYLPFLNQVWYIWYSIHAAHHPCQSRCQYPPANHRRNPQFSSMILPLFEPPLIGDFPALAMFDYQRL